MRLLWKGKHSSRLPGCRRPADVDAELLVAGAAGSVYIRGMWLLLSLAVLAVLAVPLGVAIVRSTELFVLEIGAGQVRLVRGRMPKRLFADLSDVVERARLQSGRVRVVIEGGSPRVLPSDEVPSGVAQQLRNVVGTYQVVQIRNGNMRP
jgi:hypothetical protein